MVESDKILIFDFDGTIVDTKTLYYRAIYDNLKYFGYSYDEVDKLIDKGLSLRTAFKKIGMSFLISWFLKKRILSKIKRQISNIKKCKDVDDIKNIKGEKILVTNSSKDFVNPVIKHLKIKDYFNEIYCSEDFIKKDDFIKEYLKNNKIKQKDCYYIGDRIADIEVAKKAGCLSVIIIGKCSWDSKKEILKENPDFIISSIKDLKKIIKEKK